MTPSRRKLFFVHIPKTGGATMTGAIGNRFSERESLLYYLRPQPDLSDLEDFRYVSGHFFLAFADRFQEAPFAFTVLRDPIERALSAYSFYRSRPPGFVDDITPNAEGPEVRDQAAEALRLARECSIEEFIERSPALAVGYFGSRQARALALSRPAAGNERLDDAVAGLDRCDFVGLGERLDESADLLTERLGWRPLTPLPRINVTTDRLTTEQVSPACLEALRQLTEVDRELYRHAVDRFERQLSEWSGRGNRTDRSDGIPDAVPLSDLPFDQPIAGSGWVGRARLDGRPPFCWIGHTNAAWVELARPRETRSLRVEIAHVLEQSILESLRISIDGRVVSHRLSKADGFVAAEARLDPPPRRRQQTTRVTLEVDRAVRPRDVNPDSADDRLLSIAVQRIALGSS